MRGSRTPDEAKEVRLDQGLIRYSETGDGSSHRIRPWDTGKQHALARESFLHSRSTSVASHQICHSAAIGFL